MASREPDSLGVSVDDPVKGSLCDWFGQHEGLDRGVLDGRASDLVEILS